jgi:hypothetical protein
MDRECEDYSCQTSPGSVVVCRGQIRRMRGKPEGANFISTTSAYIRGGKSSEPCEELNSHDCHVCNTAQCEAWLQFDLAGRSATSSASLFYNLRRQCSSYIICLARSCRNLRIALSRNGSISSSRLYISRWVILLAQTRRVKTSARHPSLASTPTRAYA